MMGAVSLMSAHSGDAERFAQTMPAPYASVFSAAEASEHFRIVQARGEKEAHIEIWRALRGGGAAICVVADDRPGLLSLIMMAFDDHDLDVMSAQIFCRDRDDGAVEAVDLFWVRRIEQPSTLDDKVIAQVAITLSRLILEDEAPSKPAAHSATIPVGPSETNRVYVDEMALQKGESVLVVEAQDYPGLLFAITSELHRRGVEVVSSSIHTEGGIAQDRFCVTDEEGRALRGERLASIQLAVLAAVSGGSA